MPLIELTQLYRFFTSVDLVSGGARHVLLADASVLTYVYSCGVGAAF